MPVVVCCSVCVGAFECVCPYVRPCLCLRAFQHAEVPVLCEDKEIHIKLLAVNTTGACACMRTYVCACVHASVRV